MTPKGFNAKLHVESRVSSRSSAIGLDLTTQRIAGRLAIPSINLSEIIRALDSFLANKENLNNIIRVCTKDQT